MERKKWMTYLEVDCWKWIKALTAQTGVPGSDIINELISREMGDKSGKFKAMLAKARMEKELVRLREKRAVMDMREKELEKAKSELKV